MMEGKLELGLGQGEGFESFLCFYFTFVYLLINYIFYLIFCVQKVQKSPNWSPGLSPGSKAWLESLLESQLDSWQQTSKYLFSTLIYSPSEFGRKLLLTEQVKLVINKTFVLFCLLKSSSGLRLAEIGIKFKQHKVELYLHMANTAKEQVHSLYLRVITLHQ